MADQVVGALGVVGVVALGALTGVFVYGDFSAEEHGPDEIIDFPNLTAEQIMELSDPPREMGKKVLPFVQQYKAGEGKRLRAKMESAGAINCKMCKTFFVPDDAKPWTLLSFCSKLCCAESYGTNSYIRIEDQVLEATASLAPKLKTFKKERSLISVTCTCGHIFDLAKMYAGIY